MLRNREVFRLLAETLEYPHDGLDAGASGLSSFLRKSGRGVAYQLAAEFGSHVRGRPLGEMEELYTATFDLNPVCCPYLAYQLVGDDPKRAAMMVKLQESYGAAGYVAGAELPDHVAVVLGFLARQEDWDLERDLVDELLVPGLRKMSDALDAGANPYGKLLRAALLTLDGSDLEGQSTMTGL